MGYTDREQRSYGRLGFCSVGMVEKARLAETGETMTKEDALKSAEWLLGPMSKPENARVWVHREFSGDHVIGVAVEGGEWVERWVAKSYSAALKRCARAILDCMPRCECASRAHLFLKG